MDVTLKAKPLPAVHDCSPPWHRAPAAVYAAHVLWLTQVSGKKTEQTKKSSLLKCVKLSWDSKTKMKAIMLFAARPVLSNRCQS